MALTISPQGLIKRVAIAFLTAVVVAYAGDSLWFRVRMIHPKPADPLESFTGPRVLAIPEKGGKTSYEYRSAKSCANHHLRAFAVSPRGIPALLVCEAPVESADSDVVRVQKFKS